MVMKLQRLSLVYLPLVTPTICLAFMPSFYRPPSHMSHRSSPSAQTTRHTANAVKLSRAVSSSANMEAEAKCNIVDALRNIKSGGDFCAGGKAALPCPGLVIEGVGDVPLPLLSVQASAIKKVARQAPFGQGKTTVLDTNVRDTLQIDASEVAFLNPEWNEAVQDLARNACHRMGLEKDDIKAELYNLLLYEPGGHFKMHQDTEKTEGMFGTLVVQFPSKHQGGEFEVHHRGIQRTFFKKILNDSSSQYCYHYVAHYADCQHEIRPVTEGNRLVAVYSLCWKIKKHLPSAPDMYRVLELVKHLPKIGNKTFGLLMKHEYTEFSLTRYGLGCLKGIDRALAGTLIAASDLMKEQNAANGLIFHIAQLKRTREADKLVKDEKGVFHINSKTSTYIDAVFDGDGCMRKEAEVFQEPFNFFEDVLNYKETNGHIEACFVDYWEQDELEEKLWYEHYEGWWKFERELGYTGNSRHDDVSEYSGCLLCFRRSDQA